MCVRSQNWAMRAGPSPLREAVSRRLRCFLHTVDPGKPRETAKSVGSQADTSPGCRNLQTQEGVRHGTDRSLRRNTSSQASPRPASRPGAWGMQPCPRDGDVGWADSPPLSPRQQRILYQGRKKKSVKASGWVSWGGGQTAGRAVWIGLGRVGSGWAAAG